MQQAFFRQAVDIGGIPCNKGGHYYVLYFSATYSHLLCIDMYSLCTVYRDVLVHGTVYSLYTTLTVQCNKGGHHNVFAL